MIDKMKLKVIRKKRI